MEEVQKTVLDLERFSKIVKLRSFAPFKSAAHALENIMHVSEGELGFGKLRECAREL